MSQVSGSRGKAPTAIIGAHMVVQHIGEGEPRSSFQIQIEACVGALKDAGVERNQIGALFTARMPLSYSALQFNQRVLNELKITPKYSSEVTVHGAGAIGTLELASMALNEGLIDYALCSTGDASALWMDMVSGSAAVEADLQFEAPYGPSTPALYAMFARRYMHEYGITPEQMAKVAVENRKWAVRHPHAAMRSKGEITIQDVLNSRMIAAPLHLLDCTTWFRGGIATAMVLTRPSLAGDARRPPIYLVGHGQCTTHEFITDRLEVQNCGPVGRRGDLLRTGTITAAQDAYAMAGLTPRDIDIVESSSPFSFMNLLMLEQMGFCGEGEGGRFVEQGGVDFDGGLPFNTNGGYLSFGQVVQGLYNSMEMFQQMRGEPLGHPVPNVRVGMVHAHGGPVAAHSIAIFAKEPTA